MKKQCVVCEREFEARGGWTTCSAECQRARKLTIRRITKKRYREKYPEKQRVARAAEYARARARYLAEHPEILEKKAAKEVALRAALAQLSEKVCVECGTAFPAKNNVKACSGVCWESRRRRLRCRPETSLRQAELLLKKRLYSHTPSGIDKRRKIYAKLRAAITLVRELEAKGMEALL